MGIKKYKPTSPGRRHASVLDFSELTKRSPEKKELVGRFTPSFILLPIWQ